MNVKIVDNSRVCEQVFLFENIACDLTYLMYLNSLKSVRLLRPKTVLRA